MSEMDLSVIRRKVNEKVGELAAVRLHYKTTIKRLVEAQATVTAAEEAQSLAQHVAQVIQQQAHEQIAGVVSRGLSAVFAEPYVFHIHFERKRGRTEARLTFEREGMEVDPMTASGGGVVDIASFALRMSCMVLNKPALRRVQIVDEPFKNLSEGYHHQAKRFVETLAQEMGVQFIMVTHINELRTGTIKELG